MNYLYHLVPKNIVGNILYPLNELKERNPELYEKEAKKYQGREHVMEQIIPTLNCKWNDVLHFSPVHPKEVKDALIEAGRTNMLEWKWYQIHPELLEKEKTIIYLHDQKTRAESMNPENFTQYIPSEISKYAVLPQGTKDYYREMFEKGALPLLFVKVPHILYRGSLDVSNLPIITI